MDYSALIQADYARIQALFPNDLPASFGDLDPIIQQGYIASYTQFVAKLVDMGFGNVNSLGFGSVLPTIPATGFDTSGYHPWRTDQTFINSILSQAAAASSSSSTPASQGG